MATRQQWSDLVTHLVPSRQTFLLSHLRQHVERSVVTLAGGLLLCLRALLFCFVRFGVGIGVAICLLPFGILGLKSHLGLVWGAALGSATAFHLLTAPG